MKTLIAIPCMDQVSVIFTQCLLDLTKPDDTKVCFKPGSLVYDARNLLTLTAIEQNFDNVLWIDSDMQFRSDLLERLLTDMQDTGADIVAPVCFKRVMPTKPVIYTRIDPPGKNADGQLVSQVDDYMDYPQDQIFPVAGCGFGICMTSVNILKRVWEKFGPAFSPLPWASEDISFCWKATQAGGKICADSRIKTGHVGQAIVTEELYLRNRG